MHRPTVPTTSLLTLALAAIAGGCASQPPAAAPAAPASAAARPSPNVYFYPLHAQSAAQQDRDRYECYLWARRQTGYDPSQPPRDGAPPVQVVAVPPPGYGAAAGAATGAVIGAAVSQPWDTAEGAAIGAVAGAMIGVAAVLDYRNAMASCLTARGYAVR